MKFFYVACIFCFSNFSSFSQESYSRAKCAYGEYLFVSGINIFTANFDSRFAPRDDAFGYHAGIGFVKQDSSNILVFPIGINVLLGSSPSYFEGGIGVTILTVKNEGMETDFVPTIGYRYQPLSNGMTYRFVLSSWIAGESVLLAAGISVGYKF